MRGPFEFTARSRLAAPPERVWEHAVSAEGVNHELWPLARMTHPPDVDRFDPGTVPTGERLFRSWVLLFGLVPIDYDDITLVEVDPGRGFLERSPLGSQRLWEHERRIQPVDGGCVLVDRVLHEPRIALGGRGQSALLRELLRHRHRRLRARFGGGED